MTWPNTCLYVLRMRINDGTYGGCFECGGEIAEARLRALPFAMRCKDCEEAHETSEHRERIMAQRHGSSAIVFDLSANPWNTPGTVEHPNGLPSNDDDKRKRHSPRDRFVRTTAVIGELLLRVEGEYREMPGLSLTVPQAERLWGLDASTCASVLTALIKRRVLTRTANGAYLDDPPADVSTLRDLLPRWSASREHEVRGQ